MYEKNWKINRNGEKKNYLHRIYYDNLSFRLILNYDL